MQAEVQKAPEKQAPLINNWILLFLLAMILANMGGNMYGPLLPLYLQDLNATVPQVGLFFTLARILPLILQILGGWISDSIGRLRAIAIGGVVGILVFVPLILANSWQWLLLAEMFGAVTRSLIGPSFDAFIAEHSSEKNRARVFGITQTLFGIVSVVGPPLGGWLAQDYGFKPMLMVAAGLYVLATIIRIAMAREASKSSEANPKKLSISGLKTDLRAMAGLLLSGGLITWILLTDGVRDISFSLSFDLMPLYMEKLIGLNFQQIGWTSAIFGLFLILFTIPGGWLADKTSERVGISIGFLFAGVAIGLLVIFPGHTFWTVSAAWALAGTGVGLMTPAYQSLISKAVPEKQRGLAFGLFSTSLGIVSLPAPLIGAQLWEGVSPQFPFLITAIVTILVIIPVWIKFKLPKIELEQNANA